MTFPTTRLRRLRQSDAVRRQVRETHVHPNELVLPVFVREGIDEPVAITSLPGLYQHTLDSIRGVVTEAAELGVGGIMLFGVPEQRDAEGSGAIDPEGILNRAIRVVAEEAGDAITVQADLCLDEFTDHGHCGVLDSRGRVDNDRTLAIYNEMAVVQAASGAEIIGMSGMMDGQIGAARTALDRAGHDDAILLAYSAKYASALFGPFREAVDSQLKGDRKTYQLDPANRREGMLETLLDLEEGADIVMVKPATMYLDVLADVAAESTRPVWAYHVSGEYAMIEAAAANGWIDRDRMVDEAILSIKRAGADAILTYYATEVARRLRG
ncbi:porphobilinogen synthase [Gulosibacter faecalis]|jgi:porphobilinogen synthase|uniref:Delta-aminolevulinic acid dehydratase n=1 Tax=Gulosibacter faecalis TaxID=272240 RepID=A0ABW5UX68_9MICO|nr:porphobilinogen synthase [Gulosibacter faecalis]